MSIDTEKLYNLLPAIYRIRDLAGQELLSAEEQEGVLKSLFTIISEQVAVLEENFNQLYDDQFIETCAEWVVPYIGDLVGARGIISFPGAPFSQRGQVAKTIAYRRRKGTAAVLEELAADVTGWRASVVEYFQLLATTQYLNHLRPGNLSMASLRKRELLEYSNTPFDKIAHTADVRRIEMKRGKYNIPDIGVYLWRIQSYPLHKSPAFKIDSGRYKFDALGRDIVLYNLPETEKEITHLAEPINIPMPARIFIWNRSPETYYGEGDSDDQKEKSVLLIRDGQKVLPEGNDSVADTICFSDLSDLNGGPGWSNMPTDKIVIDPRLGRIAFPLGSPPLPSDLKVSYQYGFSADIGGGEYGRLETFSTGLEKFIRVPKDSATIAQAITALAGKSGVIEIINNDYHALTTPINLAAGVKIEIRGAEECRPVLVLDKELKITGAENAVVSFNGLLFCGGTINLPSNSVEANKLQAIQFTHCTLAPGATPFDKDPTVPVNPRLKVGSDTTVTINKCIIGGLRIDEAAKTSITDSIIDAGKPTHLAYAGLSDIDPGGVLSVEGSTIIGKVTTTIMQLASNTIFHAQPDDWDTEPAVRAERLQEGCVRFSYFPIGSRLPKPYRCQPKTETDAQRIKPVFNSLRYGDAAYCQLSLYCASEIRQGAENDMEMGVFYHLYQPLREYNLLTRLNEYLRFGLEAGIYYGS